MYFRNNVSGKGRVGEWHESSNPFSFSKMKLKVMCRQSEGTEEEGTVIGKSTSPSSEAVCEDAKKAQRSMKIQYAACKTHSL